MTSKARYCPECHRGEGVHYSHCSKRRKPGRPPRLGKRASDVQFTIRLTEPEVTRYQRAADKQGLTLSQWTREAMELAYTRGATR